MSLQPVWPLPQFPAGSFPTLDSAPSFLVAFCDLDLFCSLKAGLDFAESKVLNTSHSAQVVVLGQLEDATVNRYRVGL